MRAMNYLKEAYKKFLNDKKKLRYHKDRRQGSAKGRARAVASKQQP